jgi:hypothetical protein
MCLKSLSICFVIPFWHDCVSEETHEIFWVKDLCDPDSRNIHFKENKSVILN